MFNSVQNTVSLDFQLVPDGPVLVRAQSVGLDPGLADMEFHRTTRNGERTVFLAGSGLKGVLRAHVERLLRSAGSFACDPTQVRNPASCGHFRRELGRGISPRYPHAGQCGACFTFGSLRLAGRFRVGDAYPIKGFESITNQTEVRTGVGIERKSQGAARGVLYDSEVVVQGGFAVRLTGENYTLWQVGAILQALADLDEGFVQVGGCKARGMGTMKVKDLSATFRFPDEIRGTLVGAKQDGTVAYGLPEVDRLDLEGEFEAEETLGFFRAVRCAGAGVANLRERLMKEKFANYVANGRPS